MNVRRNGRVFPKIEQALKESGPMQRKGIIDATGLSPDTVTQCIAFHRKRWATDVFYSRMGKATNREGRTDLGAWAWG